MQEPAAELVSYQVTVTTSDIRKAGTDAAVYVDLIGQERRSGQWWLEPEGANPFNRASIDVAHVECLSLGDLTRCRIGHSNQGLGSGWHLASVLVEDTREGGASWTFPCDKWLDRHEGVERLLAPLQ